MKNISVVGKKCCGCHGCEQVCPARAIAFHPNDEGFKYPTVGASCIRCGKCLSVCPSINVANNVGHMKGYAAHLINKETLLNSSSGGAFYAFAKTIIEKHGVVFGCAEPSPGHPQHIKITEMKQLPSLQGSKYAESKIEGVFSQVLSEVDSGKTVLFSGTPCQVAGLSNFIGKRDNLYTVDIVCHGVPSRKLYQEYLSTLEVKRHANIRKFNFRSKTKHQWSLTYSIEYENRKQEEHIASLSPYYSHFLKAYNYRESCYTCPYASINRPGDITIGDFWGIENVDESLFCEDGVSAVLVNNERGRQLFEDSKRELILKEVNTEDIVKNNGQLRAPVQRPRVRDKYYEMVNEQGTEYVELMLRNKKELLIDSIKDCVSNKTRRRIKTWLRF